jgi:hypothetical protein
MQQGLQLRKCAPLVIAVGHGRLVLEIGQAEVAVVAHPERQVRLALRHRLEDRRALAIGRGGGEGNRNRAEQQRRREAREAKHCDAAS